MIVLAITATVIINTLIMSVYERTREIGILAALGMRSRRIMAMFLAESSMLAVGGILMGFLIGGLMVAYATKVGFLHWEYGNHRYGDGGPDLRVFNPERCRNTEFNYPLSLPWRQVFCPR